MPRGHQLAKAPSLCVPQPLTWLDVDLICLIDARIGLKTDHSVWWLTETQESNDAWIVNDELVDWALVQSRRDLDDTFVVVVMYLHVKNAGGRVVLGLNLLYVRQRKSFGVLD